MVEFSQNIFRFLRLLSIKYGTYLWNNAFFFFGGDAVNAAAQQHTRAKLTYKQLVHKRNICVVFRTVIKKNVNELKLNYKKLSVIER